MDLINDLGNDLALAFLVERKHTNKIGSREVVDLIETVRRSLETVAEKHTVENIPAVFEAPRDPVSH